MSTRRRTHRRRIVGAGGHNVGGTMNMSSTYEDLVAVPTIVTEPTNAEVVELTEDEDTAPTEDEEMLVDVVRRLATDRSWQADPA